MPNIFPDEYTYYRSDTWDAMAYMMTGFMRQQVESRRLGRRSGFGKPMFTFKDDDSKITWDHKAMAARPFRGVK